MAVAALPSPVFITPNDEAKTLDVDVTGGPGMLDLTIHMTDTETKELIGVLVINKLYLERGRNAGA